MSKDASAHFRVSEWLAGMLVSRTGKDIYIYIFNYPSVPTNAGIPSTLIIFHHTANPRHKMVNHMTTHLDLPQDSLYFQSLVARQPQDVINVVPEWVNQICEAKLRLALLVLIGQKYPVDKKRWDEDVQFKQISLPDRVLELDELSDNRPPPAPLIAPSKSTAAARPGSLTAAPSQPLRQHVSHLTPAPKSYVISNPPMAPPCH